MPVRDRLPISGYASLFGSPDLSGDIVFSGAFRDALRRRGVNGVRMLFQHDPSEPIGRWTRFAEHERGLWCEGEVFFGVRRGRDVANLISARGLDGLSIGFRTLQAHKSVSGRRIAAIDLWEISVVTFPMHPEARIRRVDDPARMISRTRIAPDVVGALAQLQGSMA